MQNVRHSAEQKTQFLQQINYKEKEKDMMEKLLY